MAGAQATLTYIRSRQLNVSLQKQFFFFLLNTDISIKDGVSP